MLSNCSQKSRVKKDIGSLTARLISKNKVRLAFWVHLISKVEIFIHQFGRQHLKFGRPIFSTGLLLMKHFLNYWKYLFSV